MEARCAGSDPRSYLLKHSILLVRFYAELDFQTLKQGLGDILYRQIASLV